MTRTCYWPRAVIAMCIEAESVNPDLILHQAFPHQSGDVPYVGRGRILLDVTHWQHDEGSPEAMADQLSIVLNARLPRCVWRIGVAGDRYGAGLAATLAAPGHCNVISPWEMRQRLHDVDLDFLKGRAAEMRLFLSLLDVRTCGELAALPAAMLVRRYGMAGKRLWMLCRGRDAASVIQDVIPLSYIDQERVLPPNTSAPRTVARYLRHVCHRLVSRLRRQELLTGKIRIELKYASAKRKTLLMDAMDHHAALELGEFPTRAEQVDPDYLLACVRDLFVDSSHGRSLIKVRLIAEELQNVSGQFELFPPARASGRTLELDEELFDSAA